MKALAERGYSAPLIPKVGMTRPSIRLTSRSLGISSNMYMNSIIPAKSQIFQSSSRSIRAESM